MANTYLWKGRSPSGELLSGEYQTDNKDELVSYLRKRKIIITSVREQHAKLNIKLPIKEPRVGEGPRRVHAPVRHHDQRRSADGAVPRHSFPAAEKEFMRTSISRVMSDVEGGATLGEAMGRHPGCSASSTSTCRGGEAGGILDVIWFVLPPSWKKLDQLQRKVKSALTYPRWWRASRSGATAFMLIFIIPTFAKMFTDSAASCPCRPRS